MANFAFKAVRRDFLKSLLYKIRPQLPRDRIEFFLRECEREIELWERRWPAALEVIRPEFSERLEAIADLSYRLRAEIWRLGPAEKHLFFAELIMGPDRMATGREVDVAAESMVSQLNGVLQAAQHCNDPWDRPLTDLRALDLARSVVRCYVTAFRRMPSENPKGVFSEFVAEITENDLANRQLRISRRAIEKANIANRIWLDDLLNNDEPLCVINNQKLR